MYYWPTMQDMLATLPRPERDELLGLVGAAGIYEYRQRRAAEIAALEASANAGDDPAP